MLIYKYTWTQSQLLIKQESLPTQTQQVVKDQSRDLLEQ